MRFSIEFDFGRKKKNIVEKKAETKEITPFNPVGSPIDPGRPLPSIMSRTREPITREVPVSYNLTYQNTKKPGLSLQACRQIAESSHGIRICIESLKRQMKSLDWAISPKNRDTKNQIKMGTLNKFFRKPDRQNYFSDWISSVMEELLVLGVVAMAKLENFAGEKVGLKVMDGATITPILTSTGDFPQPPNPAFYQVLQGMPVVQYTTDELIYRPFSMRTWTPYGCSPVEATLTLSQLLLDRSVYYLNWLEEWNIPPAWMKMPDAWGTDRIKAWEDRLNSMMEDPAQRQKIKGIPQSLQPVENNLPFQWSYEFDEYLMRVFAWIIGVNPVWVVKTSSIGQGSEGLAETAVQEGVKPYQKFLKEILDEYLSETLASPEFEFIWIEEVDKNKALKLQEDTELVNSGVKSRNEIRTERGLDPIPDEYFDIPLITTGAGVVLVKPSEGQPADSLLFAQKTETEKNINTNLNEDLRKWKEKAKKTFKAKGTPAVSFQSVAISKSLNKAIELSLKEATSNEDIDKIFYEAKARKIKRPRPDFEKTEQYKKFVSIWKKIIPEWVKKYVKDETEHFISKQDFGVEDWKDVVSFLSFVIEEGIVRTGADAKKMAIVDMAERRAAKLVGMRWDGKEWIPSPSSVAINDTLRVEIHDIIVKSTAEGQSVGDVVNAIWQKYNEADVEARALRIARTETALAYNEGTIAGYQAQGVKRVQVYDGDGCEACAQANGQIWTIEEAIARPIEHPNCERAFEPIEE